MTDMTVTEFARTYQIPHSVVYNAMFRMPYEDRQKSFGDYPQEAIRKATIEELKSRNAFHQEKIDRNNGYLLLLKE